MRQLLKGYFTHLTLISKISHIDKSMNHEHIPKFSQSVDDGLFSKFNIDITDWPDAVVNTIMHAKNLFSSATVISEVSL